MDNSYIKNLREQKHFLKHFQWFETSSDDIIICIFSVYSDQIIEDVYWPYLVTFKVVLKTSKICISRSKLKK